MNNTMKEKDGQSFEEIAGIQKAAEENQPSADKPAKQKGGDKPDSPQTKKPDAKKPVDFLRKVADGAITAEDCLAETMKTPDQTIERYLRGINEKIVDSVRKGKFSTDIKFLVNPNDWVDVANIIDSYRSKGFEVQAYSVTPQANAPVPGSTTHKFTISWAMGGKVAM